jgi:hypothetical protein
VEDKKRLEERLNMATSEDLSTLIYYIRHNRREQREYCYTHKNWLAMLFATVLSYPNN